MTRRHEARNQIGLPGNHRGRPRAAAAASPTECFFSFPDCTSADPQVAFEISSIGDTSACTFTTTTDWGDGTKADTMTYPGGPGGSVIAVFRHTYTKPGSYTITVTNPSVTGGCGTFGTATLGFTLSGGPSAAEQGGAPNPSEKATDCSTIAPVNCATGDFWHQFTDASVPGRGVPLDFVRSYSSNRASVSGPLGFGWTNSYTMSLSVAKSGTVTITQEDGSMVVFEPNGSGGFTASAGVLATLSKNRGGGYTFRREQDNIAYSFSSRGRLTGEADLNGYQTKLTYNSKGKLTTVIDPAGRRLTFSYSGSRISKLTDPMGRSWTYSYNAGGDLVRAVDPLGRTWSFTCNAHHLLLTMTDPRGGRLTNAYDSKHRVVAQTDPAGRKTTWKYSGNPATVAGGTTTMTDPLGHRITYQYHSLDLTSVTHGAGTSLAATTSYSYDPATFGITTEVDPNGNTTTNTYDSRGNLLSTTSPLGNTTSYTYNSLNEVLTKTTPLGEKTSYSYDSHGNLLTVTDPLSNITTYAYRDGHAGDVTSITAANGNVTSFAYDVDGDVKASGVSPSHGVTDTTRYTYDADGERICAAAPDATTHHISCPAAGRPRVPGTTTTSYDRDGEVISVTNPDGDTTRDTYDGDGNKVQISDAGGHVIRYRYNADNGQTKVIRPGSTALATAYNADGDLSSQANAAGKVTRYSYDALNRLSSVTNPLGRTTRYGYDADGNQTTLTDPMGRVTTYSYDQASELTGITYSDGTTPDVSFTYDPDGQRASMTDGTGTTSYSYDADDRLISMTDGAGGTVSYSYDAAGLLTGLTYPNGDQVSRAYNGAAQLTSVTDWLGKVTRFGYDPNGSLSATTYPNGVRADSTLDRAGLLTAITVNTKKATLARFSYKRNSLAEVTSAALSGAVAGRTNYAYTQLSQLRSDISGSYAYDPAGDLTGLPGAVKQTFNAAGELTSAARPAAPTKITYGYDFDGNRTTIKPSGKPTLTLSYDQANRLIGYGAAATYSCNGDGLRMAKTVSGTTTQFSWDESGSLPVLIAAGATSYVYGPTGIPIEQITSSTPTYLSSDQQGSTRLLTSPGGAVTGTYSYSAYGQVTRHTGKAATALRYDGQYTDAESGYQYLNARYYDPATGQFLSVDPLNSLTQEPYGYATDNPVNVADPSGQFAQILLGGLIGAVAGGLTAGAGYLLNPNPPPGETLFSAVVSGAAGGLVAGACVGVDPLIAAGCGALGGAVTDFVKQNVFDETVTTGQYVEDTVFGGIGGGLGAALFPTQGFLPYKLSNLWDPGINATREYLSGIVGGIVGLIPSFAENSFPCGDLIAPPILPLAYA